MNAKTEARTYSFVVLSAITHVALATGVMFLNFQSERKAITEVEILQPQQAPVAVSEAPVHAEQPRVAEAPKIVSKTPTLAMPVAAKTTKASHTRPTPQAVAVLPTDQDTELEEPKVTSAPVLRDEDIADDLDKIDQDTQAQVATVQQKLAEQAEQEMKAQEQKLAALQKQNEKEAKAAAQALAEQRQKEKEEQVAAAAAMAAQAQAVAAQKAAEEARQAEAARLAEKARMASASQGTAEAGAVRNLEDLRQMPGNKRPQYDSDDRMAGRQGEVAFVAYVSKEGAITEFKLMKSSGHRELDAKTLKALKSWKFYPGQEGWVEIPFQWDLKGEAKEKPTTLRKSISSNP
jgi:TonB family protein